MTSDDQQKRRERKRRHGRVFRKWHDAEFASADKVAPVKVLDLGPETVCEGCGEFVDLETCGCGELKEHHYHGNTNHGFVPMGCNCLRNEAKAIASMREFFVAVVGRRMNRFEEILFERVNLRERRRGQRVEFKSKPTIHGVIVETIIVDDL